MDIVTTSLDALLHKATNPQDQNVDAAAVEAFCALINKEKDGPHIGAKLLATKIHSKNELEALHTLTILDTSMKRCSNAFHSEIGKFRFLNEMIKLVSPKYLGSQTPVSIKHKVLQLLYIWTLDYAKETKIREAYDMLKKQGVIREVPLSVSADNAGIPERRVGLGNSVFHDEEKNRLLQKLLQSKNPEDLQAANRLIKNMVKEDDKRAELKSRRISELESVHNNVRLLNEMLDSYKPRISTQDELELIKELHQSCERLRPNVFKLVAETQQNEEMLNEVLQASDELGQVFDKYTDVIIKGRINERTTSDDYESLSLLDLGSPDASTATVDLSVAVNVNNGDAAKEMQSDMDLLCDIFSNNVVADEILKPVSTSKIEALSGNGDDVSCKLNKLKALDDLDALGEHLLKENLVSRRIGPQFNKIAEKIPMNVLAKQSISENKLSSTQTDGLNKLSELAIGDALNLDLNYLMDKQNKPNHASNKNHDHTSDDVLVDITEEEKPQHRPEELINVKTDEMKESPTKTKTQQQPPSSIPPSPSLNNKSDLKLNDICVRLEDVKPSSTPPLVVLQEKNGITVTLHFGKNKPRDDVSVIVVTSISKNELPLSNLLFQAVVPKTCKLKLLQPSSMELPAYNPFLPPSAVTQIMLIANPQKVNISLKFIVSYVMDDETITEMGEVDSLPTINH